MKKLISPVRKRSVVLNGRKTSVSLENEFWSALKEVADFKQVPLAQLVTSIHDEISDGNLSSALRLHVLDFYRRRPRRA